MLALTPSSPPPQWVFPNHTETEASTSPNCPPMDVRYNNSYLFYWQADGPTMYMTLSCGLLLLNFVLNALFLKVEPWYLDAQKDSMAVMPEMYFADTLWPYSLLDKEMARWSPPKEELEDIKLRAAKARAARMGPKIVPQIPKGFDLYLYTVAMLAAIPVGVLAVSIIPVFSTAVWKKDAIALCLMLMCMLPFTMPPVCVIVAFSFFLCCLIMDLRLSWAMTFCGGLSPSFFRGVHGEMMGSMCLMLLGLWACCKDFGFPIKNNQIGNTYWEYILGDYFSVIMGYIIVVLGMKRFCETARELQEKVRKACMVASEPRFSPTGGALMGNVIGMLIGAAAADKLFLTRWCARWALSAHTRALPNCRAAGSRRADRRTPQRDGFFNPFVRLPAPPLRYVVFMPLPIFVMWLVYFPISPIAEARLPPQIVAWINERPGKFKVSGGLGRCRPGPQKSPSLPSARPCASNSRPTPGAHLPYPQVPKYMWWDWFDHMQGGKWAGIKWHPNARAVIYYIALGLVVLFMYVTGMLVRGGAGRRPLPSLRRRGLSPFFRTAGT